MNSIAKTLGFASTICLYGTPTAGYGFIADTAKGESVGDGALRFPVLSYAIAEAAKSLLWNFPVSATSIVAVFAPGGEKFAKVELGKIAAGYPLDHIRWEPAPMFEIRLAGVEF